MRKGHRWLIRYLMNRSLLTVLLLLALGLYSSTSSNVLAQLCGVPGAPPCSSGRSKPRKQVPKPKPKPKQPIPGKPAPESEKRPAPSPKPKNNPPIHKRPTPRPKPQSKPKPSTPAPLAKPREVPARPKIKSEVENLDRRKAEAKNIRLPNKAIEEGNKWNDRAEYDTALVYFDRAIELKADDPVAYYDRALSLGKKADLYFKALDYEKAFDATERAIADYDKVLGMSASEFLDYAEVYNNRGSAYSKTMNPEAAIKDFSTALGLVRSGYFSDPTIYKNRANAYILLHNNVAAISDFSKIIDSLPFPAYLGRGKLYLDERDYEQASRDCGKAIEMAQKSGEAAECVSRVSAVKQELDELNKLDLEGLKKNNPKTAAEAYNTRGTKLLGLGEFDRAIADFSAVIDMGSNNYIARAYARRGQAKNGRGDYDDAIKDLKSAIDTDANLAEARFQLGLSYIEKRHSGFPDEKLLDDSIHEFAEALHLNPIFPQASYNLALAYLEKKNYDAEPERALKDAIDNHFLDLRLAYIRLAALYDLRSQNLTGDAFKEMKDNARNARIDAAHPPEISRWRKNPPVSPTPTAIPSVESKSP